MHAYSKIFYLVIQKATLHSSHSTQNRDRERDRQRERQTERERAFVNVSFLLEEPPHPHTSLSRTRHTPKKGVRILVSRALRCQSFSVEQSPDCAPYPSSFDPQRSLVVAFEAAGQHASARRWFCQTARPLAQPSSQATLARRRT